MGCSAWLGCLNLIDNTVRPKAIKIKWARDTLVAQLLLNQLHAVCAGGLGAHRGGG
jgi:hypothetical protein